MPVLSQTLARRRENVVLSRRHGLRLGGNVLLTFHELAPAVARWITRASEAEVPVCARLLPFGLAGSLEDGSFPSVFLERGGLLRAEFIKVLFVNSMEPGLQFVYPYPPTERLAAALRTETDVADAAVYDLGNLEAPAIIRSFSRDSTPIALRGGAGSADFIVQAVFNVDHDLRLLCALRDVPQARLFIGGPHLATADHSARCALQAGRWPYRWRRPCTALLALVENLRAKQTPPIQGLIVR